MAPVEKLSMIRTREGNSKLFIDEGGGSNTLSQEVGMGHCWGSAPPSLTKAEELWDQGPKSLPSTQKFLTLPLTALTQIYPHPTMLISLLTSWDC